MAMIEAFKETIWLLDVFNNLGVFQEYVDVHCDIQNSIELAKIQVYYSRMENIYVQVHFI